MKTAAQALAALDVEPTLLLTTRTAPNKLAAVRAV